MNKDDLLARQQSLPAIESGHDGRILGPIKTLDILLTIKLLTSI